MANFRFGELDEAYRQVEHYYTQKLRRHGASPLGVDWSCMPTQALRFRKLLTLCDFASPFSLNDLGCGYGALLDYLALYHPQTPVDYLGVDLSPAMVRSAKKRWVGERIRFLQGVESPRPADYSIASGIFNVMLDQPIPLWEQLIETTLTHLRSTSRKGFAVNFVHLPASGLIMTAGLYCTRPERWSAFCETRLNSRVRIVDDYGMREFTLLVEPRNH
ncbi:class I SAM-dependent methyltransferase [Microvirga lotononidis]|uniref:Methyltransferase family protein n=1 Tax=Microvirga lotononidis TaxID=864069 RepID=I4YL07_9HYPH|nr:class I SAM-dependent methyltransferase [Microvirga lotononidis]EIM24649.1 methyltransferase family protein [Microvirga lotononidis]WQO26663.1 class I SAM-dependent methyltransferase [Microvirga lotononidis]